MWIRVEVADDSQPALHSANPEDRKDMPNMLLASGSSAQDATENVSKSITAPIYATQPFRPSLTEFIPDIEKKWEQLQERGEAAGMSTAVSCPTPPKKLLAIIYASFQLPMSDTIAPRVFSLLARTGVPLVHKKSVFIASPRAVLETIQ